MIRARYQLTLVLNDPQQPVHFRIQPSINDGAIIPLATLFPHAVKAPISTDKVSSNLSILFRERKSAKVSAQPFFCLAGLSRLSSSALLRLDYADLLACI